MYHNSLQRCACQTTSVGTSVHNTFGKPKRDNLILDLSNNGLLQQASICQLDTCSCADSGSVVTAAMCSLLSLTFQLFFIRSIKSSTEMKGPFFCISSCNFLAVASLTRGSFAKSPSVTEGLLMSTGCCFGVAKCLSCST